MRCTNVRWAVRLRLVRNAFNISHKVKRLENRRSKRTTHPPMPTSRCFVTSVSNCGSTGESLTSLFGFRRMMKELNRTLELAPDHLDALSAKGTVLVRIPAFMGGDKEKGETLLRQVIAREPAAVNARLSLAKSYCANGRHEEAVAIATKALDLAQSLQRADFIPEARQVLSQLRAQAAKGN
jgi:tetratricopeptide (TPR) repeat protein